MGTALGRRREPDLGTGGCRGEVRSLPSGERDAVARWVGRGEFGTAVGRGERSAEPRSDGGSAARYRGRPEQGAAGGRGSRGSGRDGPGREARRAAALLPLVPREFLSVLQIFLDFLFLESQPGSPPLPPPAAPRRGGSGCFAAKRWATVGGGRSGPRKRALKVAGGAGRSGEQPAPGGQDPAMPPGPCGNITLTPPRLPPHPAAEQAARSRIVPGRFGEGKAARWGSPG